MLTDTLAVAKEWLTWKGRWETVRKQSTTEYLVKKYHGLGSDAFEHHILAQHRDMKADDVRAIIHDYTSALAKAKPSRLAHLYQCVLDEQKISIEFDAGCPMIGGSPKAIEEWMRLIDYFDPDNFVALTLAKAVVDRKVSIDLDAVLDRWPLVILHADADLQRLHHNGLSDLHLHFKSLWPVPLSWQRVLRAESKLSSGEAGHEGVSLGRADAYQPPKKVRQGQKAPAELTEERDNVRKGASLLREKTTNSLKSFRPSELSFMLPSNREKTGDAVPRRVRELLAAERSMLFNAWCTILKQSDGAANIEAKLDHYLLAKCTFRARHLQSFLQSNPGLDAFDTKRRHNSHLGRMAQEETSGGGFSGRRFRYNNAMLLSALLDCTPLRRAELRIAPPAAAPARMSGMYYRLMRASKLLLTDLESSEGFASSNGASLKFAIHFKRALSAPKDRDRNRGAPASSPILRKLMEYDLETASLQSYRIRAAQNRSSCRNSAPAKEGCNLIGRIDLASPERGSGPWLLAPYVMLLRGDRRAIESLKTDANKDNPYLARWQKLLELGQATASISEQRLGVTCHAGEDYYTLVDGLWHIDSAMETWKLSAGDGIGHALALGLCPQTFQRCRLPSVRLPRGFQLDSLIWLYRFLDRHGWSGGELLRAIKSAVLDEANECYGLALKGSDRPSLSLRAMLEKLDRASQPIPACGALAIHRLPAQPPTDFLDSLTFGDFLRYLDYFDVRVAKWRSEFCIAHQVQSRLETVIPFVQSAILTKIKSAGIVIETNPSSNLRMETAAAAEDLPVFNLLFHQAGRPRVTICTDNPGTYDCNVASEYGLIFSGLLKRMGEHQRDEALAILESIRTVGMQNVNWRD